jgi:predicted enzyme related to lactoylglutathione lyase
MSPKLHCRLAGVFAVTALLGLGLPASARDTTSFQPLHTPATGEKHPGKFVWADLFTTDPVAAAKFYTGLFGWTANTIDQQGKAYTVLSNGNHPVAGLVPRRTANLKRPSRWISYIAVPDIKATLARVAAAGGLVRAPAREFPDRGFQAIIADPEGSPVGLLQSGSGDSADGETQPGDWNWFQLYGKAPKAVSAFYAGVFKYAVTPDTRTARKGDYLLNSDDLPRGGVAPLPEREEAQPGWIGVVRVEKMDETLARVTALGGEVLLAPRAPAYESRFAIIADSTGGTIGLVEYVDAASLPSSP